MADLDPAVAATWLKEGPPIVFHKGAYNLDTQDITLADWRFTKHTKALARMTIQQLKQVLIKDFEDAPQQVIDVGTQAWTVANGTDVMVRLVNLLDTIRSAWVTFSPASKAWLTTWAAYRGIKKTGEL